MNQSEPTLAELVDRVIAAADRQCGNELSHDLLSALNGVNGHPDGELAREPFAERLIEIRSCVGAGFIAVWLGAGAEQGADPESAGRHILETMLTWAATIETSTDTELENDSAIVEDEVDSDTSFGLEMLGQALVAHVSRSPTLHREISEQPNVIQELERIEHTSAGPMWVLELLRKRSGELLVIHIEARLAYRVAYQNLSNCFHLFTLLQCAMADAKVPSTKQVSSLLRSVANGETQGDVSDDAWWHYGIGTCPTADMAGSVWGEAAVDSIPVVDGEQILLLWPMILGSRGWGAGFFGPFLQALPPSVTVVHKLPDAEVAEWFQRLKLPAIKAKPWWKRW